GAVGAGGLHVGARCALPRCACATCGRCRERRVSAASVVVGGALSRIRKPVALLQRGRPASVPEWGGMAAYGGRHQGGGGPGGEGGGGWGDRGIHHRSAVSRRGADPASYEFWCGAHAVLACVVGGWLRGGIARQPRSDVREYREHGRQDAFPFRGVQGRI